MTTFGNSRKDGFNIKFKNGWTFSCQWHEVAYCDGGKTTCEIAAWDINGQWFKFPDDRDVLGWVSSDDLVDWMVKIQQQPHIEEIKNPSH